jgi:hypothetical protein
VKENGSNLDKNLDKNLDSRFLPANDRENAESMFGSVQK